MLPKSLSLLSSFDIFRRSNTEENKESRGRRCLPHGRESRVPLSVRARLLSSAGNDASHGQWCAAQRRPPLHGDDASSEISNYACDDGAI